MATDNEKWVARAKELAEQHPAGGAEVIAWATSVLTVIESLCGRDNSRARTLGSIIEKTANTPQHTSRAFVDAVRGIACGFYSDLESGYLEDLASRLRTDVEGDFLAQAQRLLEEGLKDPAAMLIGAVLEDALRQLCQRYAVPEGSSIEAMNAPLRKAGVYSLPQKQAVTAWAAIRNKADHGQFGDYTTEEVRVMHQSVAGFISKYLG